MVPRQIKLAEAWFQNRNLGAEEYDVEGTYNIKMVS